MKKYIIFIATVWCFLFTTACQKEGSLSEQDQYCEDLAGGSMNLKINGKDWDASCVHSIKVSIEVGDEAVKNVTIIGHNLDNAFLGEGRDDVELFTLNYSQSYLDGVLTQTVTNATFWNQEIDFNSFANGTSIDIGDIIYYSSIEHSDNSVDFTHFTDTNAAGNLQFILEESNTGEQITISGTFDANLIN